MAFPAETRLMLSLLVTVSDGEKNLVSIRFIFVYGRLRRILLSSCAAMFRFYNTLRCFFAITYKFKHCTNNDGDIQDGGKFCVSDTNYVTISWIVI